MKLEPMDTRTLFDALRANGTRRAKLYEIGEIVGSADTVMVASDSRWTVVVAGEHVGVAKRATYARMADEPSAQVGLSIAASRLGGGA